MMNILYATDGSEGALDGAHFLAGLSLSSDSQIRLLTVATEGEEGRATGERALLSSETALSTSSAHTTLDLRQGSTSGEVLEAILCAAEEKPTDLVVVGTRGLSPVAHFFLGSVAARVAHYTPCPTLIARPLRGKLNRVVLGVDGSAGSEQAASWLLGFPLPPECEVRLVTVVTPMTAAAASHLLLPSLVHEVQALAHQERDRAKERLTSLAASFAAGGKRAVTEIRSHEPTSGLLEIAEEQSADLIVVGAQGANAIDRYLLGSVSEKVLRHAHCSVLVVRPHSRRGQNNLTGQENGNEVAA